VHVAQQYNCWILFKIKLIRLFLNVSY